MTLPYLVGLDVGLVCCVADVIGSNDVKAKMDSDS